MINKIIEFSAHNRFLVFLFVTIASLLGLWSMQNVPLDALPDLSDTQVIVYSRWDRSPDIMEDQVTYPIITALLGAPKVKAIRGFSDFGFSYVYIIFQDGTDIYWARSRVLEYMSKITPLLPDGVRTELGPDATSIGWVFQYALVDTSGKHGLAELRSYQDWYLRYYLQSVPGVAEVAPIGGFVRQYQVTVDPNKLAAYRISVEMVMEKIRKNNNDVGGRLVEFSQREYMVRGRGYAKTPEDIEKIAVMTDSMTGTPVRIGDIGKVVLGPDIRRGVSDFNGEGDAVGGIVVMRYGENALHVIERVKAKIKEIEPTLPEGVKIVFTYDRADLIERSIETLKSTLTEEMIIVSVVILIFLWHFSSAAVPIFTIPFAIIISFIPMYLMRITSNIMSLGGIAVAIGAMVDASIVVVEQTHKKLEHWEAEGRKGDYKKVIVEAVKEVGGPSFFSLLVIAVSFIPVFALEAQEGRLFKPLAFTKNFSMTIAAVLAITLSPAMLMMLIRVNPFRFKPKWLARIVSSVLVGKIHNEEKHPISRPLMRVYKPVVEFVLRHRWVVVFAAMFLVAATVPFYFKLGSEFMPPLKEGTLLYMPTTLPGISVTEASRLLQVQDRILKSFLEVERVHGKAGRVESSTDPAPFSMMETVVVLKPESEWRKVDTWYSSWAPEFTKSVFRRFWPDHISQDDLINEMDRELQFPGVTNAWTMPIKNRIDMLTTGIRTPVGIKIYGSDLKKIEEIGGHLEIILKEIRGTRSVYAERTAGGYFLDFKIDRDQLARYNLSIDDVQTFLMSAVGGEQITTTIEGRERYPVNLRYARDYRSSIDKLQRALLTTPSGAQIPIAQVAQVELLTGPSMIRDENGLLSGYVYVDVAGRDIGGYVQEAKAAVKDLKLPTGYTLVWSGQYENMQRVKERLTMVVPLTLIIIFVLLYFNTKSVTKTMIILLALPFSAVGAIWLLYALDYNISIGVWVGLIALMGVDAETAVFMLLYLDLAYEEFKNKGRMRNYDDLKDAIEYGAVKRLRPKVMTVGVMFMGLFPIMWSTGAGADVMKRIAAPMIGGIFTSFLMELIVYPAIYAIWRWNFHLKHKTITAPVTSQEVDDEK
ncbi:CusA/CzcA family heavy metal efflux RND transporter [bacterium]|nr:CusA/CzcA family heavy metal efflux RND transporter [bacterium]